MTSTAPGISLRSTSSRMTVAARSSRTDDRPTCSGPSALGNPQAVIAQSLSVAAVRRMGLKSIQQAAGVLADSFWAALVPQAGHALGDANACANLPPLRGL